jgi:hypothetical protein
MGTLLDYLPDDTIVVLDDPGRLRARAAELDELARHGFEEARGPYPSISPPAALFLPGDAFDTLTAARPGVDWLAPIVEAGDAGRYPRTLVVDCMPAEPVQRSMERLKSHLAELGANGVQPVILCDNPGQRDRLF